MIETVKTGHKKNNYVSRYIFLKTNRLGKRNADQEAKLTMQPTSFVFPVQNINFAREELHNTMNTFVL